MEALAATNASVRSMAHAYFLAVFGADANWSLQDTGVTRK
jgi:hypothetical protein